MSARLLLLGVVAVLALTGCQEHSPSITLFTAGHAARLEAQQWCGDGKVLVSGTECPGTGPRNPVVVRASAGQKIGIDVDFGLAEHGWYLFDADTSQPLLSISKSHYRKFVVDFSRAKAAGVLHLEVRSVDHIPTSDTDVARTTGQWVFQVVAKRG